MAAYTVTEYFLGRVPDISTIIPGFDVDMAANAAMALYWTKLFPTRNPLPDISDDVLTERQKIMCALRAVVSVLPIAMQILKPKVTAAEAGPAKTKFEERYKLFKMWTDAWTSELALYEQMEGIDFNLLPTIPAFRLKIHDCSVFPSSGHIISRDTTFVRET